MDGFGKIKLRGAYTLDSHIGFFYFGKFYCYCIILQRIKPRAAASISIKCNRIRKLQELTELDLLYWLWLEVRPTNL